MSFEAAHSTLYGASQPCCKSADATDIPYKTLESYAATAGVSVHSVLYAAWAVLLARRFSSERVTFDVPRDARLREDCSPTSPSVIQPLSGRINIDIRKTTQIDELLRSIDSVKPIADQDEVGSMQSAPSSALVPSAASEFDPSSLRIFLGGGREIVVATGNRDGLLTLSCCHSNRLSGDYILAVLHHFITLIDSLLDADKMTEVGNISMLSTEERRFIVSHARPSKTRADIEQGSIHQRFRKQALLTPDAPAVEDRPGRVVTYKQLDAMTDEMSAELSSRLAQTLNQKLLDGGHGIESARTLGIMTGTSIGTIVSALAAWKSGFAIVLMDPCHPASRNQYIIKNSKCSFVIASRELENMSSSLWIYDFESLRQRASDPARYIPSDQESSPGVDLKQFYHRLSTILYTSGSTGLPKGIRHSHATFSVHLCSRDPSSLTRPLMSLNPVATASHLTLWVCLINGGCLCLPESTSLLDLKANINNYQAKQVQMTPSALSTLAPSQTPTLERIIIAGENVPPEVARRWSNNVQVELNYGSTEVGCPSYRTINSTGILPPVYSRPLTDLSIYVCDPETTRLCPLYVPGELCFTSTVMSSGYIELPDATEAAFIENPFSNDTEHPRMYRSGDLGVIDASGCFAVLGRIDEQIKVNGNRVEPNEVESIIRRMAQVRQAKVIRAQLQHGAPVLVACVVFKENTADLAPDLAAFAVQGREFCEKHLPAHMIPNRWVSFSELPVTATSKIDLKELRLQAEQELSTESDISDQPAAMQNKPSNGAHNSPTDPSNAEAIILDACLSSIINKDWRSRIGAQALASMLHHTFLENGGSSLTALKAIHRLNSSQWNLDLKDLVSGQSLKEVATHLAPLNDTNDTSPNTTISCNGNQLAETFPTAKSFGLDEDSVEHVYPASPLQCDMFLSSLHDPKQCQLPLYVNLTPYEYTVSQIKEGLQLLMEAKPGLRTIMIPTDTQTLSDPEVLAGFGHKTQTFYMVERKTCSIVFDATSCAKKPREQHSQDLDNAWRIGGLLWRAAYAPESQLLSVVFHHVLLDEWCWDMVNEDLYAILRDLKLRDKAEDSVDKVNASKKLSEAIKQAHRPSMAQWSQRMYCSNGVEDEPPSPTIQAYKKQWEDYLKDAPCTLIGESGLLPALPKKEPPPPPELSSLQADYHGFCRQRNVTTGSLISLSWALTLARILHDEGHVDAREVVFYRHGSNRESLPGAWNIEGALCSMSPLRVSLDGSMRAHDAVKQTMNDALNMRSAEPYYRDDIRPGGKLGLQRPFGNTNLDHIVSRDAAHEAEGDSSSPCARPKFPEAVDWDDMFVEQQSFCTVAFLVIEPDPSSGNTLDLCAISSRLERSFLSLITRTFRSMFLHMVDSTPEVTVDDLLRTVVT